MIAPRPGMYYRVKVRDPSGRWLAAEIGAAVDPIGTKYDVWLDFGAVILPAGTTLCGRPIRRVARVFGFMADEVERVLDENTEKVAWMRTSSGSSGSCGSAPVSGR